MPAGAQKRKTATYGWGALMARDLALLDKTGGYLALGV